MALKRKGIDVSYAQGEIDWERVKASGVEFAILRCGYGDDLESQDDSRYRANADACTRLGIPFGLYLYSYATDTKHAASEAEHILRLARDYRPAYPLYYDLENQETVGQLTNAEIAQVAQVFHDRVEKAGYFAGTYANKNWWTTRLTDPRFEKWAKWVAQYPTLTYTGTLGMWQYASDGRVNGINGSVDRDECYEDYPQIIRKAGLNGFKKEDPAPEKPQAPEVPSHEAPLKTGEEIRLNKAELYVSATAKKPSATVTGTYFVWNDVVRSGRIRITNSRANVGNASQVTGWIAWTDATRPAAAKTYTVKTGDTLSEIALRYSTTVAELVRLNAIADPDVIYTGQVLRLP